MNNHQPGPGERSGLTRAELTRLARTEGAPLTRRELRARERALATGELTIIDGEYVPTGRTATPEPPQSRPEEPVQDPVRAGDRPADPGADGEPPVVTSADVLAGQVSADSGLTRRQLRELAARIEAEQRSQEGDPPEEVISTDELESTVESDVLDDDQPPPAPPVSEEPASPPRVSARVVASQLLDTEPAAEPPAERTAERTARRPVVHPRGATTTMHTGEFDPIRKAMADINAAPDHAPAAPTRQSVYHAVVPTELQDVPGDPDPAESTDASDWTTMVTGPIVTDDVLGVEPEQAPLPLPTSEPAEPAAPAPAPIPLEQARETAAEPQQGEQDQGEQEHFELPDWHTLTNLQATPEPTPEASEGTPILLVVLQWVVIAVVAVVLGVLVWYAITHGFGDGTNGAIRGFDPDLVLREHVQ